MNMGAWYHLARPIGRHRPYTIRWEYIGRPRRAFCVFVRTTQAPPAVRADPDRSPNTEYRTVVP